MAKKFTNTVVGLVAGLAIGIATMALAQDAMFVDSAGNVGVGTNAPGAALHVQRSTDAELRVENTSTTTAERKPFELINRGKTRFVITQTGSTTWTFDNDGNFFNISQLGTGVNEFRVEGNGDVHILGTSFAANHVNTSSREFKTDIRPVDESGILEKVGQLEIAEWRFKHEADGSVHVGPMAEDFQSVFGLGDGESISTVDSDGIALAAIKALQRENESLKSDNRRLYERLERIEAKLGLIE